MLIFLIYEGETLLAEAGLKAPTPDLNSESAWQQFLATTTEINGTDETFTTIVIAVARATLQKIYGPGDAVTRHLKIVLSTEAENADCFTLNVELPPIKQVIINVYLTQGRTTIAEAQITAHTSTTEWDILLDERSAVRVQLWTYSKTCNATFYADTLRDGVRMAVAYLAETGVIGNVKTLLMRGNKASLLQFTIEPAQAAPASHAAARKTH